MKLKLLPFLFIPLILMLAGCADSDGQNTGEGVDAQVQNADAQADNTQTQADNAEDNDAQADDAYLLTFEASTTEGDALTSACFGESRLTMINVWATYCNPCLSEMPDLGEIAASYETSDFQIIGIVSDVTEDAKEEEIDNTRDLIEQTGADYPHLLLNESLYRNLVGGVDAVPTTFFVNQKGEVLGYLTGAQSREAWEEIIDKLLEEVE